MEKVKNLISVKEAAKISGYNPDYLAQLIRCGKVKGKKIGRNWFTSREAVLESLPRNKIAAAESFRFARYKYLLMALLGGFAVAVFYTTTFFYSGGVLPTGQEKVQASSGTSSEVNTILDSRPLDATHITR